MSTTDSPVPPAKAARRTNQHIVLTSHPGSGRKPPPIKWGAPSGEERGPKRDAVLLNAAGALFVAGRTRTMAEGWDVAAETIDSGKAAAKLAELQGRP